MENKKKSPTKLKQQQKTKQMTQINMNLPLKLLNQRFYNNIDPYNIVWRFFIITMMNILLTRF